MISGQTSHPHNALIISTMLHTNAFVIKRPNYNSNCQVEKKMIYLRFKENINYNYNKGNIAK